MEANPITSRVKDKFKSLVQEPLLNVGKIEGDKSDCGCGAKSPAKQTDKKVLKAAKRGAKAKAKSEFKYAQANAKFDKAEGNISRKESRARIKNSRQDFREAKKEIKSYVDY